MAPLNPKNLRPAMMPSPGRDRNTKDDTSPQVFNRKTTVGVVKGFVDSKLKNQTLMSQHNRKLSNLNDSTNFANVIASSNQTSYAGKECVDMSTFRRNIVNT